MKTLNFNEIQQVSGAGILAQEFGNAGLGFGSAADHAINGDTLSQIGSGLGFGIGSVGDGLLGAAGQVGNFGVNAAEKLGPSFIGAKGQAAGSIINAGGDALGKFAGGIIGALNPLKIG